MMNIKAGQIYKVFQENDVWSESFIVDDGISLIPLYGLKVKYILADDWEVVEWLIPMNITYI